MLFYGTWDKFINFGNLIGIIWLDLTNAKIKVLNLKKKVD